MLIKHEMVLSNDIVELFQRNRYEQYILDLMNISQEVFPGKYESVENQSNGECDYKEIDTENKFDAKLPFEEKQVRLLAKGKNYDPQITKWLKIMHNEAADFNPAEIRNNPDYDIVNTKLYQIMKEEISRDKKDENIIFFLPYPVVLSISGCDFLQLCGDYLQAIYNRLKKDIELYERKIYAIYPASRKNEFALRELGDRNTEFIYYDKMNKYFTSEVVE